MRGYGHTFVGSTRETSNYSVAEAVVVDGVFRDDTSLLEEISGAAVGSHFVDVVEMLGLLNAAGYQISDAVVGLGRKIQDCRLSAVDEPWLLWWFDD